MTRHMSEIIEEMLHQGVRGMHEGVDVLAERVESDMRRVLTEKHHSEGTATPAARGGPPASASGRLEKTIRREPREGRRGPGIFVYLDDYIAKFLECGWVPIHGHNGGQRRARTRAEKAVAKGGEKVRYPFLGEVAQHARVTARSTIEQSLRRHIRGA